MRFYKSYDFPALQQPYDYFSPSYHNPARVQWWVVTLHWGHSGCTAAVWTPCPLPLVMHLSQPLVQRHLSYSYLCCLMIVIETVPFLPLEDGEKKEDQMDLSQYSKSHGAHVYSDLKGQECSSFHLASTSTSRQASSTTALCIVLYINLNSLYKSWWAVLRASLQQVIIILKRTFFICWIILMFLQFLHFFH